MKVPRREIRKCFNLKVSDFAPNSEYQGNCRIALVTIWCADESEFETFQEGKRYLMFHLIPKKSFYAGFEIHLHSTRTSSYVCYDGTSDLQTNSLYSSRLLRKSVHLKNNKKGDYVDMILAIVDYTLIKQDREYQYLLLCVDEFAEFVLIETISFEYDKSKIFDVITFNTSGKPEYSSKISNTFHIQR
jgi:hypothetical protein